MVGAKNRKQELRTANSQADSRTSHLHTSSANIKSSSFILHPRVFLSVSSGALKTFFPAPHRHPTASTDPTDPTDLRTSPGPPAAPAAPAAPLAPGGLGSLVAENPKDFSIDWGNMP